MSKAKIINKTNTRSEPTKDIDNNNKSMVSDDEKPRKVKKNNKKAEDEQVKNDGVVEQKEEKDCEKISEAKIKKKRLTKNEIYKSDQNKLFDDLKILIEVKTNGTFTSENIKNKNDEITSDILERFKKYYDSSMSRGIDGKDTKASVAIIKKIFGYHGFEVIGQEYKKTLSDGKVFRGTKYVMVPSDDI